MGWLGCLGVVGQVVVFAAGIEGHCCCCLRSTSLHCHCELHLVVDAATYESPLVVGVVVVVVGIVVVEIVVVVGIVDWGMREQTVVVLAVASAHNTDVYVLLLLC